MSNVEFEEDKYRSDYLSNNRSSGTVLFIKKISGGMVQNEKQAQFVMIVFVFVTFIISLVLFFDTLKGPNTPPKGLEGEDTEIYDDQLR